MNFPVADQTCSQETKNIQVKQIWPGRVEGYQMPEIHHNFFLTLNYLAHEMPAADNLSKKGGPGRGENVTDK